MRRQQFFPSDPVQKPLSTRLSDKKESKNIIEAIEKLRKKKKELEVSSKKAGFDSIEQNKYDIVTKLFIKIDKAITDFNDQIAYEDTVRELQEFINLLRELVECIDKTINNKEHKDTLMQFRNKNREYARAGLTIGVWSGIGLALAFSSVTAGASAFVTGLGGASLLESQTDINSPVPKTYQLIIDLMNVLKLTTKDLILTINSLQLDYDKSDILSNEDNMVCPLSNELIKDPVLFKLDGYSYERDFLKKWLLRHKTSPLANKQIEKSQKFEDVIIFNPHLKYMIDKYEHHRKEASTPTASDELSPESVKFSV